MSDGNILPTFDTLSAPQQSQLLMTRIACLPRDVSSIIVEYCGTGREIGAVMMGANGHGKSWLWHQMVLQAGGTDSELFQLHRIEAQRREKKESLKNWQSDLKSAADVAAADSFYPIRLPANWEALRMPAQRRDPQCFSFHPNETRTHCVRLWDCTGLRKYIKVQNATPQQTLRYTCTPLHAD
jgi:hypothetical protein